MSELRRRIFGGSGTPDDDSPSSSRDASPGPLLKSGTGTDYTVIPAKKLEKLKKKIESSGGIKRRHAWVFGLGGLFGIFIAGFFASSNGSLDKLVTLTGLDNMNLDSILDVLPAGIIREVRDLQVCRTLISLTNLIKSSSKADVC